MVGPVSPRPLAVLRDVPLSLPGCALTHVARKPIDADRARAQHRGYAQALRDAGCDVLVLPADEALPDCVFIEDLLVDLGPTRLLTAPGAPSRWAERDGVRAAFAPGGPLCGFGPLIEMPDGLRLDGGDVLAVRGVVFVGRSTRTDSEAIAWLAAHCDAPVVPVNVRGALHLKTAVTPLCDRVLLADPEHVDLRPFMFFDIVCVAPGEAAAANALRLPPRPDVRTTSFRDERVLLPAGNPKTATTLRRWGIEVFEVEIDELSKAEAGLTCMSVLLGAAFGPRP